MSVDPHRLDSALHTARQTLLAEINTEGYWTGKLSSSALSTATAIMALHLVQEETGTNHDSLIQGGLQWLAQNANEDGGWGDTVKSISNISTTTLCWAVYHAIPGADKKYEDTLLAADAWLTETAGGTTREELVPAIIKR